MGKCKECLHEIMGYLAHILLFPVVYCRYQKDGKYSLVEWQIPNESNDTSLFVRTGERILEDGTRGAVSRYSEYQFGTPITFGKDGTAYDYFDYGLADPTADRNYILDSESGISLTHKPADADMMLKIGFRNQSATDIYVNLSCNDNVVAENVLLAKGVQEISITIPQQYLQDEKTLLSIKYEDMKEVLGGSSINILYASMVITK